MSVKDRPDIQILFSVGCRPLTEEHEQFNVSCNTFVHVCKYMYTSKYIHRSIKKVHHQRYPLFVTPLYL